MTSIKWKSAEILKVFGTTIREGTFTGSKPTASGTIVRDDPTTFTPANIAKIYENITTHVPMYLGHSTVPDRQPIGYAYKFGVTENLDDIKYNGFIFNQEAMRKISTEGWDKVSPEITPDLGNLEAICFVQNPAISDTGASLEPIVFSGEDTNTSNSMTEEVATTQASTPNTGVQQSGSIPAVNDAPKVSKDNIVVNVPPANVDVSALASQVEDYRSKYEQASAKVESLMTDQYKTVAAEVKTLGIADPESLVRGLSTEQKISVLSKMKESLVTNKPLAKPTESTTTQDTSKSNDVFDEALKELGITRDEYNTRLGKK